MSKASDEMKLVEEVLAGGDPETVNEQSRNALMLALKFADSDVIRALVNPVWDSGRLLRKGANLLQTDAAGRSALFYAVERGDVEIVWVLLESLRGTGIYCPRGTLLTIRDQEGHLAEDLAEQNGEMEIRDILQRERYRIDYFE